LFIKLDFISIKLRLIGVQKVKKKGNRQGGKRKAGGRVLAEIRVEVQCGTKLYKYKNGTWC
jgi:hypothetical protein